MTDTGRDPKTGQYDVQWSDKEQRKFKAEDRPLYLINRLPPFRREQAVPSKD